MHSRVITLAAVVSLLAPAAFAAADSDWAVEPSQVIAGTLSDGRYKIVERKSNQALDLLKELRNYSEKVSDASETLRKEMLSNHYEDWVNTKLLPSHFEAKSLKETIAKTYDLEKNNVKDSLKKAKAGDFSAADASVARVNAFEADYEAQVKANEAKIDAVRSLYNKDFGSAKAALAAFNNDALIKELLGAKPKLVKEVFLEAVNMRPIQWAVVLRKQQKDSNDPRFGHVPTTVSVDQDGAARSYKVIVR